jgi:hypothetical protein
MELSGRGATASKLHGSYIAPVFPEAPEFCDPREDLKKIGVPDSEFVQPGHSESHREASATKAAGDE